MSLVNCKVYNDGSHYFAFLPGGDLKKKEACGARDKSENFSKFKVFYSDMLKEKISKKDRKDYIKNRFWESFDDIAELPSEEELKDFTKRYLRSLHAMKKRYLEKAFVNVWNWFITFTYDDNKITYEEFEPKIKKALSNQSTRNDWRYMAGIEEGEEKGRKHFHVIANIPEGKMPGTLELRYHYSTKKRRIVYYTANTLFDKYGDSDFSVISDPWECRNKIFYLIKYISKSTDKLIYSRGIKNYVEMVIDTDSDVVTTMQGNFGTKYILFDSLFVGKKDEAGRKFLDSLKCRKIERNKFTDFSGFDKEESKNLFNGKLGITTIIYSSLSTGNGKGCYTDQKLSFNPLGRCFLLPEGAC